MSETLIAEGQTQNADTGNQDAAAPTAAPAAEPATAQPSQQATEGQTAEGQQADATSTDGEPAAPQGAPEKYEFKAPEGQQFDEVVLSQFSEIAKELDLPQDAAQKMLDKMAPAIAARQTEQLEAARSAWGDASKTDKEFGGDKLDTSLATAKRALETFGNDSLRTLLNESGLGNHPEIIRFMLKAGKAISEDSKIVKGNDAAKVSNEPLAKRLYPNLLA